MIANPEKTRTTVSFKPLHQQVMVITGASSGIGLATALAAADQGVKLVLASRNQEALADVVAQITESGGQAIYVVADVGEREQVQRIADAAIEQFGGFDTWVNDAGLGIWGRLEEVSDEDHRRLFDTNFWGVVYGSLVAVAHLRQRGGTLINLGSVASDIAFPLQGMYSATKHAIKAFTDALRMELEEEKVPISITLIKPAGIDTPFTQHARNYTQKEPKLPPPVYHPQEVANAILHAATHAQRDMYIGGGGKLMSSISKHAPRMMDWLGETVLINQQQRDEPARNPAGALFQAGNDGQVRGDHPGYVMRTSLYTRSTMHPVLSGAVAAALSLVTLIWLSKKAS